MSRYSKNKAVSPESQSEAIKLAKGAMRPGQTKEQTKLISQGIQKGIDQYKKQHKAKMREQDKQRKQAKKRESSEDVSEVQHSTKCRPSWIPWLLLIITWLGIGLYWLDSAGVLL